MFTLRYFVINYVKLLSSVKINMAQSILTYQYGPLPTIITSGTNINLLSGAPLTLSAGLWSITISGEISNVTAGDLEATDVALYISQTNNIGPLIYVLNDQIVPLGNIIPADTSAYYARTFFYPVNADNTNMLIELQPIVAGVAGNFTQDFTYFAIKMRQ